VVPARFLKISVTLIERIELYLRDRHGEKSGTRLVGIGLPAGTNKTNKEV
jgi:hypothetical protein